MSRSLVGLVAVAGMLAMLSTTAVASGSQYADNVFGDWGGAREEMQNAGVDVSAGYLGEFAYNIQGGSPHTGTYVQQLALGAALNFDRMFGWKGGTLHVLAEHRVGPSLDQKANLGLLQGVQDNFGGGDGVTRLIQLYIDQTVFNNTVEFKYGRMMMGDNFYQSDCVFQNYTFCGPKPANTGQPGLTPFPFSQTGFVIKIHPSSTWDFSVARFKVNPNNFDSHFFIRPQGPDTGHTILAQITWHTDLSGASTLPGTWKLGGWRASTPEPDVLLDVTGMPRALTGAPPLIHRATSGAYFVGEQQVTHNQWGGGITLFGNGYHADGKTTEIDSVMEVGMIYKAPFASRPHDAIRVGLGRVTVGSRYNAARRVEGLPTLGSEYATELDYVAQVYRGIQITPNLQVIRNPGAVTTRNDVLVFGLEVSANF